MTRIAEETLWGLIHESNTEGELGWGSFTIQFWAEPFRFRSSFLWSRYVPKVARRLYHLRWQQSPGWFRQRCKSEFFLGLGQAPQSETRQPAVYNQSSRQTIDEYAFLEWIRQSKHRPFVLLPIRIPSEQPATHSEVLSPPPPLAGEVFNESLTAEGC